MNDGNGADGYAAVAVRVRRGGKPASVVLAAPARDGAGLTLATKSALPYFNWGDMARPGSPVDQLRGAVATSSGAQDALDCLRRR
ncbi:hypothetical protein [Nocardioides sp.]|uniref:hypothetical protein n=1 Tax=Nocardioides sp. TaxID=35761 RepID=UPI0037837439